MKFAKYGSNFALADLPERLFPIEVEALHPDTREVVWHAFVERPPDGQRILLEIPPLRKQLGHPVTMRIRFGDGTVSTREPDPERLQ
jgi:hypothetical protein